MPSGYTSKIYDGKEVCGADFIADCAKGFGAYITVRDLLDSEKPDHFEPDSFYIDRAKQWEKELEKLLGMTEEEAQHEADEEYERKIANRENAIKNKNELRQRYEKVLEEVSAWIPPTEDHVNLKEFCIKQIEDSIEWDCSTSYYDEYNVERTTGKEWLKYQIQNAKQTIENCLHDHESEVERTNQRNLWIKQLKDSLVNLK